MMIVNDIQEKQKLMCNHSSSVLSSTMLHENNEFEKLYELFPISNEESLINLKEALTNDNTLYDKMVCIYTKILMLIKLIINNLFKN